MADEKLIEEARLAYVEAWEREDAYLKLNGHPKTGHQRSRSGIVAAFAVFEEAHAPTDEKLIEEARKAIHGAMPGTGDYADWVKSQAEGRDFLGDIARAALAVFEKAHAPTFPRDWTCPAHGDSCAKQGMDWDCTDGCRHRCPECRMGLGKHLKCDPLCEIAERETRSQQ